MERAALWVRDILRRRPFLTNTVIYVTCYTAAEMSRQTLKIHLINSTKKGRNTTLYLGQNEQPEYDFIAAARIIAVGAVIYPPTLYFWYKFLDRKFLGTSAKVVAAKVASDQLFLTPILLACFYTVLGYLENEETAEEIRHKYIKTLIANEMFWIPAQTINFLFMPPHLRLVYVSVASFIWMNVFYCIKRSKVVKNEK